MPGTIALLLTLLSPIVVSGKSPGLAAQPYVLDTSASVHADYPAAALKRGEEGTVNFLVHIDRKNRITSCQIARSSGYATLDKATCDLVIKNGRFALNEQGQQEVGGKNRLGIMSWTLPAFAVRPVEPPPFSSAAELARAGARVICKYSNKVGSQIIEVKQCHTRQQWLRAEQEGREEAVRLTVGGGTSTN